MDRRLPSRIREVRDQIQSAGKTCGSEDVKEALTSTYPEYKRMKQLPLRRLIMQELSTPAAPAPALQESSGGDAQADGTDRSANGKSQKKKRKAEAGVLADESPEVAELDMNSSLRKMYNPDAKPLAASDAGAKKTRHGEKQPSRQQKAAARAEHGLSDPQGGGFAPEERPEDRLEDLGGINSILADLRQLIVQPLAHPEVFAHLGVQPPTGVLLHGPPGSGKTKLAHALAGTTGVPFFKVAATEIVSGMSGESEAKIRNLFQAAMTVAPSILFLDEIDAITPKRDSAGREMERRIVAQMLTCMDELRNTNVIVLGCTNRPDALDPALRRAGRFDREISMGIPDEPARARILEKMIAEMRVADDLDLAFLAKKTPGYVGADLSALTKEAALSAVSRAFADLDRRECVAKSGQGEGGDGVDGGEGVDGDEGGGEKGEEGPPVPYTPEELAGLSVQMSDFELALTKVQPSSRREGFTTIPDVAWEDIGALQEVRADLDAAVCEPIRKAPLFKQLGLTVPVGVLLFGPPGCGKTLLAKATANASGANFIAVKGPELLNKYVGESERAVRVVFARAKASSPCVIFFDELDALVPRRSAEGSTSAERVVNQMLTEMDGVAERSQVYVIAATNRPDIVDPAMLRPGRLDRLLYVPLPSAAGRLEILQAHMRKLPLDDDVNLKIIAQGANNFSGADLASLAREAAMLAIRTADVPAEIKEGEVHEVSTIRITANLMARARERVSPSVVASELKEYEVMAARLCGWKPRKEDAEPQGCEPPPPAAASGGGIGSAPK